MSLHQLDIIKLFDLLVNSASSSPPAYEDAATAARTHDEVRTARNQAWEFAGHHMDMLRSVVDEARFERVAGADLQVTPPEPASVAAKAKVVAAYGFLGPALREDIAAGLLDGPREQSMRVVRAQRKFWQAARAYSRQAVLCSRQDLEAVLHAMKDTIGATKRARIASAVLATWRCTCQDVGSYAAVPAKQAAALAERVDKARAERASAGLPQPSAPPSPAVLQSAPVWDRLQSVAFHSSLLQHAWADDQVAAARTWCPERAEQLEAAAGAAPPLVAPPLLALWGCTRAELAQALLTGALWVAMPVLPALAAGDDDNQLYMFQWQALLSQTLVLTAGWSTRSLWSCAPLPAGWHVLPVFTATCIVPEFSDAGLMQPRVRSQAVSYPAASGECGAAACAVQNAAALACAMQQTTPSEGHWLPQASVAALQRAEAAVQAVVKPCNVLVQQAWAGQEQALLGTPASALAAAVPQVARTFEVHSWLGAPAGSPAAAVAAAASSGAPGITPADSVSGILHGEVVLVQTWLAVCPEQVPTPGLHSEQGEDSQAARVAAALCAALGTQ